MPGYKGRIVRGQEQHGFCDFHWICKAFHGDLRSGLGHADALAEDAVRYYEMRLLDFLGFRPQLIDCANCGREIKVEERFFSFSGGGVICPRCGQGLPNLRPISVETLKYLRHFQRSSYGEAARAAQSEAEQLMQGYFTYLLERELNSPGFLKRVRT